MEIFRDIDDTSSDPGAALPNYKDGHVPLGLLLFVKHTSLHIGYGWPLLAPS